MGMVELLQDIEPKEPGDTMFRFKASVEVRTGTTRIFIMASAIVASQEVANDNEAHAVSPTAEGNANSDYGDEFDPIEEIISAVYGD